MFITKKSKILNVLLALILSFLVETYIVYIERSILISNFSLANFINYFSFKHYIMFLVIFLVIFYVLYDEDRKKMVLDFIYKYRFPLALLFLVVCLIFQIHGSSINELNFFNVNHNTLFGVSRQVRADEFNVNTMLAFSQYFNNFSYFSDIVRATPTDMFLLYGQPVWDAGLIFKPFLIGYLFLNQGQGLSFFWISRLVVLFLVSFEFGKLLTNRNKKLALAYSLLITFSPLVQWWFAINGLVEQLIFGQLGVLLINFYMKTEDYRKRLLSALGMMICIGGFGLVMYPSWQIPFGYVFVLLALWIFLKNRKTFSFNKKDFLIIIASVAILGVLIAHILLNSLETLKILMNTVYPGSEVFNGQFDLRYFFNYVPSAYFPIMPEGIPDNVVERSTFIDFFPVPLILSFIVLFYQKTKDKLLYGLLALYFILAVFLLVALPDSIISLTLRSHVRTSRIICVIGFVGCLILIRSISSLREFADKKLIIPISVVLSAIVVYSSTFVFNEYYATWMIAVLVAFYSIFISIIFFSYSPKGKKAFLISCIALAFLTGALVNPVDSGTDVVFESNYIHEVESIVHNDSDANWIVTDLYLNSLIPVGAETVNSINTYPDLDKWHTLDPNGQYEDVYNRYSHICVIFQDEKPTEFLLYSPDIIHLYLNVNDLEKLNVTYISTPEDLTKFSNDNVTFNQIYEENNYKIYHVSYR